MFEPNLAYYCSGYKNQFDQSWTRWDKRAQRMLQRGKACYHFARARVVEFLSSVTSFCISTAYSSAELWVNIWSSCHSFKTCFNRRNGRKQTREEEVSCNSTVYFLRSYGAKNECSFTNFLFFLARTKRRNARLPSEEKDVRVSVVKVGNNFFTVFIFCWNVNNVLRCLFNLKPLPSSSILGIKGEDRTSLRSSWLQDNGRYSDESVAINSTES